MSDLTATVIYPSVPLTEAVPIGAFAPVTFAGGEPPYVYKVTPSLPNGLSFDTRTGIISGKPTSVTTTASYSISATDSLNIKSAANISLEVRPMTTTFSFVEGVAANQTIIPFSLDTKFSIISGKLPGGLSITTSTGIITGTPDFVLSEKVGKFVLRISTQETLVDKTLTTIVEGADTVLWSDAVGFTPGSYSTSTAYLPIGPFGEKFALNNQYVKYQFSASPVQAPSTTNIRYYLPEGSGVLPPGLSLSDDGILSGILRDTLTFDGTISDTGGYDEEEYDKFSYDHGLVEYDSIGVPKIYQFKVTATDGVTASTRYFKIMVVDVEMIRHPDRIQMNLEPGVLLSNTNYLPPVQFIKNTNLGIVRANNAQVIDISAHDPYPQLGIVTYTVGPNSDPQQVLPKNLSLTSSTGIINGYIPFQPAYSRTYNFTVHATRTYSTLTVTATSVFQLVVKGDIESSIEWVTPNTLPTLIADEISELAVIANRLNSDLSIKYRLISGALPHGIVLTPDGCLSGIAQSSGTFTFTVLAQDVYEQSGIEKTFTLTVLPQQNNVAFTTAYVKPYLSLDKRTLFKRFMSDETVFLPNSLYRPYDTNFGIQNNMKLILEFGIERLNLSDYRQALRENFYNRKLYFGDIKIAVAADVHNNSIYEVVYIDIVDNLVNSQKISVASAVYTNSNMYYPASVPNMRDRLNQIVLDDFTYIRTNESRLPRFMRTPQLSEYRAPGYMIVMPLCYVLPGEGKKIVTRLRLSGFDFKQFDFEIDRLFIQNSLDNTTDKYLIFDRTKVTDQIESDKYLYGLDNIQLNLENGNPLEKE